MPITVKIKSHAILGGGPFSHCVYKVDVDNGAGVQWYVYRRYSEFCTLYDQAEREVGYKWPDLGVTKLETEYGGGGTLYGTYKETILTRIPILERYLQKLVSLDPARLLACVANFIDMTNHGASGVSVQCGAGNILVESFLHVKAHFLSFWQKHLIVLTKSGTIYEMRSMQDNSSKAVASVNLCKKDVRVKGRTSKMIIDIEYEHTTTLVPGTTDTYVNNCRKLHILFTNQSDMANFLRYCTEFTSNPTEALDRGYKGTKAPPKEETGPVSHDRQEGLGNTKDVLSSTYGL